jgi:hypothetical protein
MPTISPPVPYTPTSRVVDDDDDYEYFWSRGGVDFRIPRWLAEIVDVPVIVRLEIFLIGVCTGLVVAAIALIVAFWVALG